MLNDLAAIKFMFMRGETCPTWLNRPYSREKPKPEMEYMSTSNCSPRKND